MNLRPRALRQLVLPIMLSTVRISVPDPAAHAAAAVTIGGPFTLTAPDGATVSDRTFAGKWLLVYFGYTHCPETCPTALLDIADALRMLGPDAAKVQPIFITIDPRRDTPDVLGDYTRSFDDRIIGLTGTQPQIDAVAEAYGAYAQPHSSGQHGEDVIDHSVYIYLMDPQGRFARAFEAGWPAAKISASVRDSMADHR